ncbi:MAG: trypsin-like peptidase domain-containing protein [Adhaeribacter sp.]
MKRTEAYQQIEKYLQGQLSGQDLSDFEQQLATDPVLAGELRQMKELTTTLRFYNRRRALKQQLATIHEEIAPPAYKQPLVNPFAGRENRRIFWNQHYATIAVAASVAILTVFGTLLSVDLWRSMGQQQAARYSALRREVEGIKKSQRDIIRGITGPATKTPPKEYDPGNFSGTGFAISHDGYLVTSYHVISGADSVFIENRAGERYKVKSIFRDKTHDLAILKIEDAGFTSFDNLPYAFKSSESDLGERVYTLGYPREDMVFGEGSLSSRSGFEGDTTAYQVSIPVNPGNSGGPLLDNQGNLIGVISGKQLDQQGAAFAVKSAYLKQLVEQLSNDSLEAPIRLPKKNLLAGASRTRQLKSIQDFVFNIKVYNK